MLRIRYFDRIVLWRGHANQLTRNLIQGTGNDEGYKFCRLPLAFHLTLDLPVYIHFVRDTGNWAEGNWPAKI